jgi:hypothetical protein
VSKTNKKVDKEKSAASKAIAAAPLSEKQRENLKKDLKKYSSTKSVSGKNVTKAELAKIQTKISKYTKALTAEATVSVPSLPSFPDSPSTSTTSIKLPEKDNVLSLTNNNIDEATIIAMVFEKLGAVELTKFTRTDTVEGINPYYNIISNLSDIKKEFDPSNLVASQKSDTSLYNAFSIKLSNKIPGDQYLEDRGLDNYIYVDTNGDLIIELDNITPDELVEVEIDTNGTIVEVR